MELEQQQLCAEWLRTGVISRAGTWVRRLDNQQQAVLPQLLLCSFLVRRIAHLLSTNVYTCSSARSLGTTLERSLAVTHPSALW